jgi:hypothetical protein
MRIAVVGSRTWSDVEAIESLLDRALGTYGEELVIVSGGAKGADTIGERWARRNQVPTLIHLPFWDRHGRKAGFVRNQHIVRDAELVIAFRVPGSKGTQLTIDLALKAGIPCHIIEPKGA